MSRPTEGRQERKSAPNHRRKQARKPNENSFRVSLVDTESQLSVEKPGPATKLSTGDRRGARMSTRRFGRGHSGVGEMTSLMSKGGRMRTVISAGVLALALGGAIPAVAAAPVSAATQRDDCPQKGLLGTVTGGICKTVDTLGDAVNEFTDGISVPLPSVKILDAPRGTTEKGSGDTARAGDTAAATSSTPDATGAPAPEPVEESERSEDGNLLPKVLGGVCLPWRPPPSARARRRAAHPNPPNPLSPPRPPSRRSSRPGRRVPARRPAPAPNPRGRRRPRCRPGLPGRRRPGRSRRTRANR